MKSDKKPIQMNVIDAKSLIEHIMPEPGFAPRVVGITGMGLGSHSMRYPKSIQHKLYAKFYNDDYKLIQDPESFNYWHEELFKTLASEYGANLDNDLMTLKNLSDGLFAAINMQSASLLANHPFLLYARKKVERVGTASKNIEAKIFKRETLERLFKFIETKLNSESGSEFQNSLWENKFFRYLACEQYELLEKYINSTEFNINDLIDGKHPMVLCIHMGKLDLFEKLLAMCEPSEPTTEICNSLFIAALHYGDLELIEKLINRFPISDTVYTQAFLTSARIGDTSKIFELIFAKVQELDLLTPNIVDTALTIAIETQHPNFALMLLKNRACSSIYNYSSALELYDQTNKFSPILAKSRISKQIRKYLLSGYVIKNAKSKEFLDALQIRNSEILHDNKSILGVMIDFKEIELLDATINLVKNNYSNAQRFDMLGLYKLLFSQNKLPEIKMLLKKYPLEKVCNRGGRDERIDQLLHAILANSDNHNLLEILFSNAARVQIGYVRGNMLDDPGIVAKEEARINRIELNTNKEIEIDIPEQTNRKKLPPLELAIIYGKSRCVYELLHKYKARPSFRTLAFAAARGETYIIRLFLNNLSDINKVSTIEDGDKPATLLMRAAQNGHLDIINTLLTHPAIDINLNLDFSFGKNMSAADIAIVYKQEEVFSLLLNYAKEQDISLTLSPDTLNLITQRGNIELLKIIISEQLISRKEILSTIEFALEKGKEDIFYMMLQHVKLSPVETKQILTAAAKFSGSSLKNIDDYKHLLGQLIKTAGEINSCDEGTEPLLILAAKSGNIHLLELLLEQNIDLEVKDINGKTALVNAIESVNLEFVKLLLQKGANINCLDQDNNTPLMTAIMNKKIQHDRDMSAKTKNLFSRTGGLASLLKMPEYRDQTQEVLEAILAYKPNLNLKNKAGETAAMLAAKDQHSQALELLAQQRANFNIVNNDGDTVLFLLFKNKRFVSRDRAYSQHETKYESIDNKMFELVVQYMDDINLRNQDGETALHLAVKTGSERLIDILISKGADLNARDANEKSPLLIAVEYAGVSSSIVKKLLQHGADLNIKHSSGESLLAYVYKQMCKDGFATANHPYAVIGDDTSNLNSEKYTDKFIELTFALLKVDYKHQELATFHKALGALEYIATTEDSQALTKLVENGLNLKEILEKIINEYFLASRYSSYSDGGYGCGGYTDSEDGCIDYDSDELSDEIDEDTARPSEPVVTDNIQEKIYFQKVAALIRIGFAMGFLSEEDLSLIKQDIQQRGLEVASIDELDGVLSEASKGLEATGCEMP